MTKSFITTLLVASSFFTMMDQAKSTSVPHRPSLKTASDQSPAHLFGGIVAFLSKEEGRKCSHLVDSVKNLSKSIPEKPKGYKGSYVSKADVTGKVTQIVKQAQDSQEKALTQLAKVNKMHTSDINLLLKLFSEIYGELDIMAKNCRNNTKAVEAEILKAREGLKSSPKPSLMNVFGKKK